MDPHGSGYQGRHGANKPCRNCFDPRTWFKATNVGAAEDGSADAEQRRPDCPLFVDELGRSSWNLLHTMAAKFPDNPTDEQKKDMSDFLRLLSKYYPCEFCAEDFRRDLRASPPDVTSQKNLSVWMCQLHNAVNKKLGKAEYDCGLVQQRWKDGWDDGSCDR